MLLLLTNELMVLATPQKIYDNITAISSSLQIQIVFCCRQKKQTTFLGRTCRDISGHMGHLSSPASGFSFLRHYK